MVDRNAQPAGDVPGKGHHSRGGGVHRRPGRNRQVDPPVAAEGARGSEPGHDGTIDRGREQARSSEHEGEGHDDHGFDRAVGTLPER